MNVLIGCESSGVVRDEFLKLGHNAWSCDLLPSERPGPHHQGDILELLARTEGFWDLFIVFPDCTYLCGSGLHWNKRRPGRAEKTEEALRFVQKLLDAKVPRKCLENPVGCIGTRIRPASQSIQPYDFGEDASKRTCLWLENLPLLVPTQRIPGRIVTDPVTGKQVERWANQTDSGQNRLGPSEDRWKDRARTYTGPARAMAEQWGGRVENPGPAQQLLPL